jgi:dUTP pyrophosphatase
MRRTTKLPVVKIKVFPGGHLPVKKTKGAAAYDCYARIDGTGEDQYYDPDCELHYIPGINGVTTKTPLGFALEMPENVHALILARSSMGVKTKLVCPNGVGLIDSDYRGEICMLYRELDPDYDATSWNMEDAIYDGDRIAQLLFNVPVELVQADELSETERGAGGFGSTGVNDEATK